MKLAVLVPHRDRQDYVEFQKKYLTNYLSDANLDHHVIFCEQRNDSVFNRSITLNHAFKFAWETYRPDYIVVNDVDMVPLNLDYSYKGYTEFWFGTAGGVKITSEHFIKVNGYNPKFEGWGYEDEEFWGRADVFELTSLNWHQNTPEGRLVNLELTSDYNSEEFSKAYYGEPTGPRMLGPHEIFATSAVTAKYTRAWDTNEHKIRNLELCNSIKRLPKEEAKVYYANAGLTTLAESQAQVNKLSDSVAEIYWR